MNDTILVKDVWSGEVYSKPCVSADRNNADLYDDFSRKLEALTDIANKYENPRIKYSEAYNRGIKNVIFNPPATIVFWNDDTKTVVKAINEPYDWEKGIAMAYVKKMCGNQGNYYNIFRKYEEAGLKAQGNPQEGEVEEIHYDFNKSYTKKRKEKNTISPRNIAADIIERFEDLLDKHDINIPDDDRNADPNAASIYGVTYDTLLSEVEDIVASALKTMKANPDLNIAEGVFY